MPTKLYTVEASRYFDRINGNTYHAVRITRHSDGAMLKAGPAYGYGDCYRQTALETMAAADWIPEAYKADPYRYERENDYPVIWTVSDGLKRDMVALVSS